MKIVYNSAYVQIETFNFTFTQQAVIVYFYCAKQAHIWQRRYRLQAEDDVMACFVLERLLLFLLLAYIRTDQCKMGQMDVTFLQITRKPRHRPRA